MKIIYIVGYERSGSTLLHNILAESNQTFGVGELRHFEKRLGDLRPCSCKENIYDCAFWGDFAIEYKGKGVPHFTRDKFIFFLPFLKLYFKWFRKKEVSFFKSLYNFASSSSDKIIIDSSKSLVHLFLLRRVLNFNVKVIHIVRDPRGILFSVKKRMEQNHEKYKTKNLKSVLRKIDIVNYWSFHISKRITDMTVVRYEDMINNPLQTLDLALKQIDSVLPDIPQKDDNGIIEFTQNHNVDGGPTRHMTGNSVLKVDDAWRTGEYVLPKTTSSFTVRKFYS